MPMTFAEAALAHRRLINQLRASELQGAAALAAVLDACTLAQPCRSAACPRCGIAFQAAMVGAVDDLIREPARALRSRMHALTIVPASGCLLPDALTVETCARVGAEIGAALADLDLPSTLVGLEVSFNEDTTGEVEPHCCVHGHGAGLDWLSRAQKEALRARFPASPLVRRPIRVEPLDQDIRGRQYPFKSERSRRVTFLVTDHPTRAPTERRRIDRYGQHRP